MWSVHLDQPWLTARFERPVTCVGWTPQGGGSMRAQAVLWRQVRNEDLHEDFDVLPWLARETAGVGYDGAPCFLTSAVIADYEQAQFQCGGIVARVMVTAGLGNAERVGQRRAAVHRVGTINALLGVSCALSAPAALEALSLMAEARTLAMLEEAPRLWNPPPTGTGTDCLCVAFPDEGQREIYAGKHTDLGEAVGHAALAAFRAVIRKWSPAQ